MGAADTRIRWKRAGILALALGAFAAFALCKPLLFPAPPTALPPIQEPNERIAATTSFFEQAGTPGLYSQCGAQHDDAVQMFVEVPFAGQELFVLRAGRLHAAGVFLDRARPKASPVARSFDGHLAEAEGRSLWQLVDLVVAAHPSDRPTDAIDGPTVWLEICRGGNYTSAGAVMREDGPKEAAVFDLGIQLARLAHFRNWLW